MDKSSTNKLPLQSQATTHQFLKKLIIDGGAVAEWSKALLVREDKGKPKDPWSPRPGKSFFRSISDEMPLLQTHLKLYTNSHMLAV